LERPSKPTISWNGNELSTASTYSGYQWIFNDSDVNNANSHQYKPLKPGNYKVRVSNVNQCSEVSDVFNLVVTAANMVTQNHSKVSIYPNPATSSMFIDLGKIPLQPVTVQLLTIEGRPIVNWIMQQQRQEFLIDHIQNGTYLIQVIDGKINALHKVVIQAP
jgi:hypothetical protein